MAGLGNNLYPPIFKKSYLPAFDIKGECTIYFSLSVYNSYNSIKRDEKDSENNRDIEVQITVQHQNTNYSALNLNKYPAGIKTMQLSFDPNRTTDDKYYVTINSSDMQNGFVLGQYYKVQIRFTDTSVKPPTLINNYNNSGNNVIPVSWFTSNLKGFSEWSQVVLIKGINSPKLRLRSFSDEEQDLTFTLKMVDIIGNVDFKGTPNEHLKKYRILLYDSKNTLLDDSKDIVLNVFSNLNEIQYKIKRELNDSELYRLVIKLQSSSLYEWEKEYEFTLNLVQFTTLDPNNFSITATPDDKAGWIKVHVQTVSNILKVGSNFVIKRKSSKDNFASWEDVNIFLAGLNKKINYDWVDKTVESGVWYYYALEQVNQQNFRSNDLVIKNPVSCRFEDIFLLNGDKQLKVRFNPQVNNYSHVVSESLTQTIGSKYPYIRRNGNTDYRTFSLNGTISFIMDIRENGMKASKYNLYGSNYTLHDKENANRGITPFNDSILERDFREQVIKFLYQNNVKLYKSTTEGNMLVKLMNISFTPNNTLSRHIYDFTCTAQQVDEFNLTNCDKYGIQSIGEYVNKNSILIKKYGQVMRPNYGRYYALTDEEAEAQRANYNYPYDKRMFAGTDKQNVFEAGVDIISTYITPKYKYLQNDDIQINVSSLSSLKIQFSSLPYGIGKSGDKYKKCTSENDVPLFIGHIINVNGNEIIVNKEGIYQITDENISVTSLSFPIAGQTAALSYYATIVESERLNKIPNKYSNIQKIGQLFGKFELGDSIYTKIYRKYNLNVGKSSQQLQRIKGLRIQTTPNAVFYIKEAQDKNYYNEFIIGDTGLLEFYDQDTDITGIYPVGVKLRETTSDYVQEDEYKIVDGDAATDLGDITDPKENHVYTLETGSNTITAYKNQLKATQQANMQAWQLNENEQMLYVDMSTILLIIDDKDATQFIYYKGGWYLFKDGLVITPIEAIIDYYCNILRLEYQE